MKQTTKLLTVAALALGILTFAKAPAAHAASITVNSSADTATQDDGDCTLREAINNVNAQSDTTDGGLGGDCTAADGSTDTITLPATTILLTSDLPQITESVTINGQGMGQTVIDGGGAYMVISSEDVQQKTIGIHDLRITAFNIAAIMALDGTTTFDIDNLDIDGSNSTTNQPFYGGMLFVGSGSSQISDVFIHDMNFQQPGLTASGIGLAGASGSSGEVNIKNLTVNNMGANQTAASGVSIVLGLIDGSYTPAALTLNISNSTFSNLNSIDGLANAINATAVVDGGDTAATVYSTNNTFSNIHGASSNTESGALNMAGGAIQSSDSVTLRYISKNNLYIKSFSEDNSFTCGILNANSFVGGQGDVNIDIQSLGGNLSDDTSCSSYFTQPTDQNNITNLSSFLEALADNGGSVPTMALKQGSPAIDAGITIAGLTTDARGIARPQGLAYDAGAYESPYTRQTTSASLASTGEGVGVAYISAVILLLTSALGFIKVRSR